MYIYLTDGKDEGFDNVAHIGNADNLLTKFMISKLVC